MPIINHRKQYLIFSRRIAGIINKEKNQEIIRDNFFKLIPINITQLAEF